MGNESDDVKRWTARRKATAVMDILKGRTTASELARSHDLTVAEVEQWLEDFVSMGTEALRSHPRGSGGPTQSGKEGTARQDRRAHTKQK
jgi:transposase-like protein